MMKTIEQILENYEDDTLDGSQSRRFAQFLAYDQLPKVGLKLKEDTTQEEWGKLICPFTRENVLNQLHADVVIGFKRALDKDLLRSSSMFDCVRFWNWVLEEGLENWDSDNFAVYGLPLFKATAIKYGWSNPIGNDEGKEDYYKG